MKLDITRVDVWAAGIEDRPGGLAQKLDALALATKSRTPVVAGLR